MSVKRVDPAEAAGLLDAGWTYVDVRTVPEFDQGHPEGAYNTPLHHATPSGRAPNPDFEAVFVATFPDRGATIVIGCRSGARSFNAAIL